MRWTLAVALAFNLAYAQELKLHFIDVGQGDSVLVRSPTGQNVLYDGGRPSEVAFETRLADRCVWLTDHPDTVATSTSFRGYRSVAHA